MTPPVITLGGIGRLTPLIVALCAGAVGCGGEDNTRAQPGRPDPGPGDRSESKRSSPQSETELEHPGETGGSEPFRTALPAPSLTATRASGSAVIHYRYSPQQWSRLPDTVGLILAVKGSEEGSLPRNAIFRLRRPSGSRRLGLPRSPGPYVVYAQTLMPSGGQGPPATTRLQR
jgi:hypothetical protein